MKKEVIKHILAWLAYYLYALVSDYIIYGELGVFLDYLIFLVPHAWAFYSVYFIFEYSRDLKNKLVLKRIGAIVLSLSVFYLLTRAYVVFVMPVLDPNYQKKEFNLIFFLTNNSLVYFKYFIYGIALFYAKRAFGKEKELRLNQEKTFKLLELQFQLEQEKQKREEENLNLQQEKLQLENEKLQYQYAYLRTQVNPHTLQNLLNMLISKAIRSNSPDLADAIITLSAIMRYSMDVQTDDNGRVPLEGEIQHIHNILKMHSYRTKETICMNLKTEGDIATANIIPLAIIPFIENAIKYAVLNDPLHPLQIHITVNGNAFTFYTKNKIKSSQAILDEGSTSHGIGSANTQKRLRASYHEDGYEMTMEKQGDDFIARLYIPNLNRDPKIIVNNIF